MNPSASQPEFVECPHCSDGRQFKGRKGLNIHITRCHGPPARPLTCPNFRCDQTQSGSSIQIPFEILISKCNQNIPLVKRIPRGARISLARSLSHTIQNVLSNSVLAWQNLFLFSYKHFYVNKSENGSLCSKLKNNTLADRFLHIPNYSFRTQNYDLKKIVENKVMDGDLKNAARILFSNDTLAPFNDITLEALHQKHPLPNTNFLLPNPPSNTSFLQIKDEETYAAIMSFSSGSAGGMDGITPQHLKDLVGVAAGDAGKALLSNITRLCNLMLSGEVNSTFLPFLYGARLCAFNKKDGGIRPIAIGCTFRRLVSKLAVKHIVPILKDKFQPIQIGFGSKGGCEAAVHSTRTFLENGDVEVLLKVDVKNAFNCLDRTTLLSNVATDLPEIYPYIWQCYSTASKLFFGNFNFKSNVGVQQGDPLGPALFSLGIHSQISKLTSKYNIWYLDDGTIGGNVIDVIKDLNTVKQEFAKIGLELNFSKCELFYTEKLSQERILSASKLFNEIAPNIHIVNKQSLCLLGAPLYNEAVKPILEEKIKMFSTNTDKLAALNSHIAFSILKYCLFVPKLMYILRASPIWKISGPLEDMDATLKNALEQILNLTFNDHSWNQATLPVKYGGIGVRKISSVALPAFLSSVHSVKELSSQILHSNSFSLTYATEALESWKVRCPNVDIPKEHTAQKLWDVPLVQLDHMNLLQNFTNDRDKARLLALCEKESGYWLHALPSKNLGTLLDNESFRVALGLRLGTPLCHEHRCPCGKEVDKFGIHGLSCPRSSGRLFRHGSLNDTIKRALATINIPALIEPAGISRDDGKRPDGLTLVPWERGRALMWDATCVDTLAPCYVRETASRPGAAAEMAENGKRRKYVSLIENYIFVPFAVETLGPWSLSAKKFFKDISPRLITSSGDRRAGSFFAQRISLAIQRGNAASILGTIPRGHDLYTNL